MDKLYKYFSSLSIAEFLSVLVKVLLVVFTIFIACIIYKGIQDDGYILHPLKVPQKFHDAGYTGDVLAGQIQDRIVELKKLSRSVKEDSIQVELNQSPDLNLQILGLGLSSNSLSFHLKRLLGIQSSVVSGELVDIDNKLKLTLRMTGMDAHSYEEVYHPDSIDKSVQNLLKYASEEVLRYTDPYRLGVLRFRDGALDEAEWIVRKMLEERPKENKWSYMLWGNIKKKRDDHKGALRMYKKSLEYDENFDLPLRNLGWHYFNEEDYMLALDFFERSINSSTNSFSSYNGRAICYQRLGESTKAEDAYKKTIERFPENLWSHANYWQYLVNIKHDTIEALKVWENANLYLDKNADYYVAQSTRYILSQETDSIKHYIDLALDYDPYHVEALQIYSNLLSMMSLEYSGSDEVFRKFIHAMRKQNYEESMMQSGYNRWAMNDYKYMKFDSAIVHARKAIEINAENPYPWTTLAETYAYKKDHARFYGYLDSAIVRGFELKYYVKEAPYNLYSDKPKFRALLKKSEKDKSLKD